MAFSTKRIAVRGARTHNLKNIDVEIPHGELTVITGLSGSGKSSLAFDTLYAEGQRRYVESLSSYARQFLQLSEKPDVDAIDGLSPAIAIEQKATSHNPRSTVGTVTEIHDYLRLLFSRCGVAHCPTHHLPLAGHSVSQMVDLALRLPLGTKAMILSVIAQDRKGEFLDVFTELMGKGFERVRIDGKIIELSEAPKLDKKHKHDVAAVVDRISLDASKKQRLAESFETAIRLSPAGLALLVPESGPEALFSSKFSCPKCAWSLAELEPRLFSFNSPAGACVPCSGLGSLSFFDARLVVSDPDLTVGQGAIAGWDSKNPFYKGVLGDLARHWKFSLDTPWKKLGAKIQNSILHGSGDEIITFTGPSRFSAGPRRAVFEGVLPHYERRWRDTQNPSLREEWSQLISSQTCSACKGSRLRPEARAVLVDGRSMQELNELAIEELLPCVQKMSFPGHRHDVGLKIQREVVSRLEFLEDVGLGYLSLSRSAETLSGGEAQRIRLASQIGSGLTGVMYVLDEPSIGLHQRDNAKLIATLKKLKNLGNTVIVVEHDHDTIMEADFVLDIGPGAGIHGGEVVASGSPAKIQANPKSLTGAFLSGKKFIPLPERRRLPSPGKRIELLGCSGNNLKKTNLSIPTGLFTCVCGVSGSGKSTLINDTLYKAAAQKLHKSRAIPFPHDSAKGFELIDRVIDVDQSPIGRTPRSNPATYTGLFTPIRELFSQSAKARERGYDPGRFSFNVKGGRCETCEGAGLITVEMHFLPDMHVACETCLGKRYNRETLDVEYKGKSISDVLEMTVEVALPFFSAVPAIHKKLQTLSDVGLGYIKLGQAATTFSGGEAQRIKLALELSKRETGNTLFILDEPTTGLHFQDTLMLLGVLERLVSAGNTVVVIEHNLDVIKAADWIIDIGPEGGARGGRVVAEGPPEALAQNPKSVTGPWLAPVLARSVKAAKSAPSVQKRKASDRAKR